MLRLWMLLLLSLIVLSACNLNTNIGVPAHADGLIPPVSVQSNNNTTADRLRYTDERIGFTFDYPQGWSLIDSPNNDAVVYSITLASYDLEQAAGVDGIPEGRTKIDVIVDLTNPSTTLETIRANIQQQVDNGQVTIIEEEVVTPPNGTEGILLRILDTFGSEVTTFITTVNGYAVTFSSYGDEQFLQDLVQTLQPQ